MGNLLRSLFNLVMLFAAVVAFLIILAGVAMKSFGDTTSYKPAIFYPKGPTPPSITVMQIDTGVDYNVDAIGSHILPQYKSSEYMDVEGHGTHVAGIILKDTCDNVKLIPCRFFDKSGDEKDGKVMENELKCLGLAAKYKVDVVNFSAGGQYPNGDELEALKKLNTNNTIVVVAAGNDGHELTISNDVEEVKKYLVKCGDDDHQCKNQKYYYYPASYSLPNLIKVSNYYDGDLVNKSNDSEGFARANGHNITSYYLGGISVVMSGTSQATAAVTNKILLDMCETVNR